MQAEGSAEPWFVRAFRSDYLAVYAHRDLDSARREAAALVALLGLQPEDRILDLCCGSGRHLQALAECGLHPRGVDLSADLLKAARHRLGPDEPALARADMRALPLRSGDWDGVLQLFTSFGYFDDAGDRAVLAEVARVLRPAGVHLLDLMNGELILRKLVPRSEETRGELRLVQERRYEPATRRIVKTVRMVLPDGQEQRWEESVRIYEREEIVEMLAAAGLTVERVCGDFDGRPYERASSARMISIARADPKISS